ncbi:MAG: 3'(2'),5'-bisphosphate nucleotidase CysQ [Pseudomonadales bacterium]|nr:3'(2'),5'-bisphosphate nucleotidase CysQ [Pseudomonadales bacterium]
MNIPALLEPVKAISRAAGAAILGVYHAAGPVDVEHKADASPVTQADLAAHQVIAKALQALTPELPVLSEEALAIPWATRQHWQRYWLVDPLDGTKEFIKRNGEFTVNIALIDEGVPVLGVVYVPVQDILYSGVTGHGACKEEQEGEAFSISTASVSPGQRRLTVVASRSHRGEILEQWLNRARCHFPELELVSMGSSLKICLVAEGRADIYPRLAPTSEWDTAAAQAVLEAAGGLLTDSDFTPYRYNRKADILNPHFFALGDPRYPWLQLSSGRQQGADGSPE